jgi:hypothetical protein
MITRTESRIRLRPWGAWRLGTLILALAAVAGLRGGPPFLTDDPEPVDLNHWEAYVFGQGERTGNANFISGPAIELNYGIVNNVQLHLVAPEANISTPGSGWTSGYGDTEFGVKYRFLEENDSYPQVGIFPMAEFATGSAAKGLGNGRTWYRLPLWIQKGWGPWTVDAGGGVELNSAPGARNQGFAGALLQRDLGKYLTLGAEVFQQPADPTFGRATTLANAGGYLKFTENFNVLFSAGRSLTRERYTVWYLGLYWTGGPKKPDQK